MQIPGDLSARNVLISEIDGAYCLKVSDFGLARITQGGDYNQTGKFPSIPTPSCFGSDNHCQVKWSAPEVFTGTATSNLMFGGEINLFNRISHYLKLRYSAL